MAHLVYWPSSFIKAGIGPNSARCAAFFLPAMPPWASRGKTTISMVLIGLWRPALPVTSTLPLLYRLAAVRHRSWVAAAGMAGFTATTTAAAHIGGFLSKKPYAPPSWASHLSPMPSHTFALGHVSFPIPTTSLPDCYLVQSINSD
jgi:hypothetical protein